MFKRHLLCHVIQTFEVVISNLGCGTFLVPFCLVFLQSPEDKNSFPTLFSFLSLQLFIISILSIGPKVSSRISVQALREYYDIPLDGDAHRAMSDVNLLTSILERMTFDMKLSITDLLERSFRASDLVHSKKKNNKKKL